MEGCIKNMLIVKTFNILHIFFYRSSKIFDFGEIFFRGAGGSPAIDAPAFVSCFVLIRVISWLSLSFSVNFIDISKLWY